MTAPHSIPAVVIIVDGHRNIAAGADVRLDHGSMSAMVQRILSVTTAPHETTVEGTTMTAQHERQATDQLRAFLETITVRADSGTQAPTILIQGNGNIVCAGSLSFAPLSEMPEPTSQTR